MWLNSLLPRGIDKGKHRHLERTTIQKGVLVGNSSVYVVKIQK
ncbi:sema domain, seven thrombospondin repeats (type 1 and type 1-like), transmembrane domain (TM) and short cytoplasmic domain, (semaphorin) 5B (predicted), isoform CRA_e [Rattus norvegicus]|uniref:Sema domain, seven thrombospondin repeats (Type 1 and type 1-like), transmembrane domain (TM) and short cytoplasmic domain, (Semaphorin) 5B (Predicted), isoform CRA_e n=1 Tax=Rattus norvegicus TaxID=10116 RepID=A6IRG0_RAT|nr:sema domain, seven thrombospondin repeats (type 1 and type 1-like), transmembrane domain (TM) and short cytoplasmic domain, (semaphorin) 5B (predicted), isoform CRA_e [Rattus norvegicus]